MKKLQKALLFDDNFVGAEVEIIAENHISGVKTTVLLDIKDAKQVLLPIYGKDRFEDFVKFTKDFKQQTRNFQDIYIDEIPEDKVAITVMRFDLAKEY